MGRPETEPVIWSEDLQFPFCAHCLRGKKCACEAKDQKICDFCDDGCQCGYEEAVKYGYDECNCDCSCDEDAEDDDDFEECDVCAAGGCNCGADDYPGQCDCECECKYTCSCACECPVLVIDHESFNEWVKEVCYVCDPGCLDDSYLQLPEPATMKDVIAKRCLTEVGPYEFGISTIPESIRKRRPIPSFGSMLGIPFGLREPSEQKYYEVDELSIVEIVQGGKKGFIRFDGPTHLAVLFKYGQYQNRERDLPTIWMSLTPMEILTQKPGLDIAHGNVLIGGLGMGWLTQRVLQKPEVTSVTQVELDLDILKFFGIPLLDAYPNRLQPIHDDFWNVIDEVDINQFDTILVDIWPNYAGARNDPEFQALRKAHPNVWGWGMRKKQWKRRSF